jgi:hypothetical protein
VIEPPNSAKSHVRRELVCAHELGLVLAAARLQHVDGTRERILEFVVVTDYRNGRFFPSLEALGNFLD